MANVTYLIGAGASAGALPTVANFPAALKTVIDNFNGVVFFVQNGNMTAQRPLFEKVKSDLEFLLEGCRKHMSVDTFCRMLYLTSREEDYKKAKCAIVIFFELYRYYNSAYDKRYDAFLATILNKEKPRFPSNINIISWNYDCEFEKAFLNYHYPPISMGDVYNELNVLHKNGRSPKQLQNDFGIVKINGTAGFYAGQKCVLGVDRWNDNHNGSPNDPSAIFPIVREYNKYINEVGCEPMVSFVWDDDAGEQKIKEEVKAAISSSTILVIIGYSFPYFNRQMDKFILDSFENKGGRHLDVFIQDHDADILKAHLESIKRYSNTLIQPIKNVGQFYIPYGF